MDDIVEILIDGLSELFDFKWRPWMWILVVAAVALTIWSFYYF